MTHLSRTLLQWNKDIQQPYKTTFQNTTIQWTLHVASHQSKSRNEKAQHPTTLPETTNTAPENRPSQKEFPSSNYQFPGAMLLLGSVNRLPGTSYYPYHLPPLTPSFWIDSSVRREVLMDFAATGRWICEGIPSPQHDDGKSCCLKNIYIDDPKPLRCNVYLFQQS